MDPRVEECLKRLSTAKEVVYDAETSGLDWRKQHVVGHVITVGASPDDTYYLPFRHAGGGNIEGTFVPDTKDGWDGSIHPIEKEIIKLLERPELTIIGHHLSFDLKFLYRLGLIKMSAKFQDTMLNATLINEWFPSFSLDYCTKAFNVATKKTTIYDYLIEKFPELRATPKQAMGSFWRLAGDDPQAVEYAAGDGTSTWELRIAQQKKLEEQGLIKVHGVECRLIPVLARMTTRGIKIDVERLNEIKIDVEQKRIDALATLPKDFNPRAPSQVKALMEEAGCIDWPLTPTGRPSFPEKWLEKNPVGKKIVDVRKYSNILSSFIEPMLTDHLWNGRVHPEYNQLRGDEYGTITGRLSSSNPNLQQVHKRNAELGQIYRSIFVPDDGRKWGSVDYSQCEPRLLAYYSRSKVLLDGYRNDPDFDAHLGVAQAINASAWDQMDDAGQKYARENGKRVNQTLITGGGKGVIVERYGVDPAEVDKIWSDYFEAMPEIRTLQRRAGSAMKSRGYVHSLLGRRSRLNDPNKSYVAVNRLLQCGNADIVKLKMCEIDEFLMSEDSSVEQINSVHDSVDFQFEEKDRAVYERCLEIMTSFGPEDMITLDVPMKVDAGEGRDWAIATYGEASERR